MYVKKISCVWQKSIMTVNSTSFTNGTLIDEEFCEAVQKLGNISFSLSLEGFEEVNDGRRGAGIFDKVLAAMDLMKKHGLLLEPPSVIQEPISRL